MIKVESYNGKANTSIGGNAVTIMAETCSVIRALGTLMAENSSMTYRQAVTKILTLITIALQETSDEG